MNIQLSINIDEETGRIDQELWGDTHQITPAMAAVLLNCKISEIKEMIHPHCVEHVDEHGIVSRSFGYGYGEATNEFYRDLLKYEWRLGYDRAGIGIALTTWGGFPIYPMCKNGNELCFQTEAEAMEYLIDNKDKWSKLEFQQGDGE
jgi:hypothetical protein